MILASNGWFFSTGWGAAAALAGIIALPLLVAGYWAVRHGEKTRRINYSMPTVTPLVTGGHLLGESVEVRRGEKVLANPQVVVLHIAMRGPKDVVETDFQGKPLTLDISVPVLEVLSVENSPLDTHAPEIKIDGTTLKIGPAHLHPGQQTKISVLVDGQRPTLVEPMRTLVNVQLKRESVFVYTAKMEHHYNEWFLAALGVITMEQFTVGPQSALATTGLALSWSAEITITGLLRFRDLATATEWGRRLNQRRTSTRVLPSPRTQQTPITSESGTSAHKVSSKGLSPERGQAEPDAEA